MIAGAPVLTMAAAWDLIEELPRSILGGATAQVASLLALLARERHEDLAGADLMAVTAVLPLILGLPWRSEEARRRLVDCWFATPARQAQTLSTIATAHPQGRCLITGGHDGGWVPRRLLSWLSGSQPSSAAPAAAPTLATRATRWVLSPDYPVPVLQCPAGIGMPPTLPPDDGDLRLALCAGTLAELRLAAAPWAARFAWCGQPIEDILALGGFDGLTAAALLLHRGSSAIDGWQEARRTLGVAATPGWAGAVLAACGTPARRRLRAPAPYAWMTADFEATADERSSSADSAAEDLRRRDTPSG